MLYVDVPTLPELKELISSRADACLSICLPTTPETQHITGSKIAFGNLVKTGLEQLEARGLDKRRRDLIEAQLTHLADDEDFWRVQANSLVVLATATSIRTYRLATVVSPLVQVADRFYLKPLLRSVAFPQTAFVLALSENAVRLIEIFADSPPSVVQVADLPKSAADAAGRASVNNLTQNTRLANAEGQTVLLRQFARKVDAAIRTVLAGRSTPLIVAATEPLGPIFRSLCSYPALLGQGIAGSPDRLTELELATEARSLLDIFYREQIDDVKALYEARFNSRRATTDIVEAARAATNGAIESLMVDIDGMVYGTVDETDGAVVFADTPEAGAYDIVEEIAGRAILAGAGFLAVRNEDVPGNAPLAVTLRYPI
ncbi:hypothetical protein RB623_16200 [Mesorhizobium sp. LHD-90]|uniref:baeRF11 domain-containing protein n=1 Tax=Mesorhizobium sp. LHD-90 TaxID=3071414 RepID=UPI0027E06E0B|nr:hypothetical protein [Mesorhizobium sp. LHD-90]MDQ6435601.1 hypothetical protein [Mesorhizobium sp. LHD-90]